MRPPCCARVVFAGFGDVFAIDDEARHAVQFGRFKQVLGAVDFFFHRQRIPGFFCIGFAHAVFGEEFHGFFFVEDDAEFAVFVHGVKDFGVHRFFVHAQLAHGVVKLRAACPLAGDCRDTGEFQRRIDAVCQPFLQLRLHVVAVRAAVPEKFDDFARLDVGDSNRQYVVIGAFAVFHRLRLGGGGKGGGKREGGQGVFQHG